MEDKSQTLSIFEVIGPCMIGPSSSHTAGALRIALITSKLLSAPITKAEFTVYASFADTLEGHGTDRALVAGLLGFEPDDIRIRDSIEIAESRGIELTFVKDTGTHVPHPNTVRIRVETEEGGCLSIMGSSLGGGAAEVNRLNDFSVEISGNYHTLVVLHRDSPGVMSRVTGLLASKGINIAFMRLYRTQRGRAACAIIEVDQYPGGDITAELMQVAMVGEVYIVPQIAAELPTPATEAEAAELESLTDELGKRLAIPVELNEYFRNSGLTSGLQMLELATRFNCSLAAIIMARELQLTEVSFPDAVRKLRRIWQVMANSVATGLAEPIPTMGGLIGGGAAKMRDYSAANLPVSGALWGRLIAAALAVPEVNAAMGLIAAAPTAGAAGVIPACLTTLRDEYNYDETDICEALLTIAAVGYIVMLAGSVSGAEAGCQAEVGTASAMAAAGIAYLRGGDPDTLLQAASFAFGNILGMVCDPIRGLVESPCQQRNVIGAANAMVSADLAMAGIRSPVTFDGMVATMLSVGRRMPVDLRETGRGGMAHTAILECAQCVGGQFC